VSEGESIFEAACEEVVGEAVFEHAGGDSLGDIGVGGAVEAFVEGGGGFAEFELPGVVEVLPGGGDFFGGPGGGEVGVVGEVIRGVEVCGGVAEFELAGAQEMIPSGGFASGDGSGDIGVMCEIVGFIKEQGRDGDGAAANEDACARRIGNVEVEPVIADGQLWESGMEAMGAIT